MWSCWSRGLISGGKACLLCLLARARRAGWGLGSAAARAAAVRLASPTAACARAKSPRPHPARPPANTWVLVLVRMRTVARTGGLADILRGRSRGSAQGNRMSTEQAPLIGDSNGFMPRRSPASPGDSAAVPLPSTASPGIAGLLRWHADLDGIHAITLGFSEQRLSTPHRHCSPVRTHPKCVAGR